MYVCVCVCVCGQVNTYLILDLFSMMHCVTSKRKKDSSQWQYCAIVLEAQIVSVIWHIQQTLFSCFNLLVVGVRCVTSITAEETLNRK